MALLVADGLRKEYADIVALQDFTLTVDEGEIVALVGHNGSGKSTLLRLIAGLLEPTDGVLVVANSTPGTAAARAAVSYLPDQPVLYDDLSVIEHVDYVVRLHGETEWPAHADPLIEAMGLSARADDLPVRFSRGLRQRTAIVLALVRPFSILLVDEPFVGLDPRGQHVLTQVLLGAAEDGAAVLVATHQLGFLETAHRCVALHDGAVMWQGSVDVPRITAMLG